MMKNRKEIISMDRTKNNDELFFFGLEIHIGLNTQKKLYCDCKNSKETCGYCLGHPGFLPIINWSAIEKAVKIIKMLKGTVQTVFCADRKHYIYPDLPKKFQITQLHKPLGYNGFINIMDTRVNILNFALEEDAGRNLTDRDLDIINIDFKRCGNPLLELTTDYQNINNIEIIINFLRILKRLLKHYDYSNADVLDGTFRFDLNLSMQTNKYISPRIEIKNINSILEIKKIVNYERFRIIKEKPTLSTTRGWNGNKTFFLRNKENYFFWVEKDVSKKKIFLKTNKISNIYNDILDFCKQTQMLNLKDIFKLFNLKLFNVFKKCIEKKICSKNFFVQNINNIKKWVSIFSEEQTLEILKIINKFQPVSIFIKENTIIINKTIEDQADFNTLISRLNKNFEKFSSLKDIDLEEVLKTKKFCEYFSELNTIVHPISKQRKINFIIGQTIQYLKNNKGKVNLNLIKNKINKYILKYNNQ